MREGGRRNQGRGEKWKRRTNTEKGDAEEGHRQDPSVILYSTLTSLT